MKKIGMVLAGMLLTVSVFTGNLVMAAPAPGTDGSSGSSGGNSICPDGSINPGASTLAGCNVSGENTLMKTLKTIIDVVIGVLGFVAVVMIVVGGIQYVTSAGDAQKTKKAKDTIMYAIIGLVVAILAFAVVNFVLANVFSGSTSSSTNNNSRTSSNS